MVPHSNFKPNRVLGEAKPHYRYRFEIRRNGDIEGSNPVCDHFLRCWWELKPPDGLPQRQDIKLTHLRGYAPYAVILDLEGGRQFEHNFTLRTRLLGTAVAEHYGEITGRDIADMDNSQAARRIYYTASLAIDGREPVLSIIHGIAPEDSYKDAFALYMPLVDERGAVAKILVAVYVTYFAGDEGGSVA